MVLRPRFAPAGWICARYKSVLLLLLLLLRQLLIYVTRVFGYLNLNFLVHQNIDILCVEEEQLL